MKAKLRTSKPLEFLDKTVTRDEKGRYSVLWPWRAQTPHFSDNFGLCLGRLKSLMKRMHKNVLLKEYDKVFEDQRERGVIKIADRIDGKMVHYLPHQAVITPKKRTAKLRIVFDASAKSTAGTSLNEALYRGLVIIPQPCGVLLRARSSPNIIVGDIEKAFLQIALDPEDRDVARFLW